MKVTVEELQRLAHMDIRDLKREDLDNAGDIEIDRSLPAKERMMDYLQKCKNPYAENVGKYILMVTYDENSDKTLEDRMVEIAKRLTHIPM